MGVVSIEPCNREFPLLYVAHIGAWAEENLPQEDRERFRQTAQTEVLSLHQGNFDSYEIRPGEYEEWRAAWTDSGTAN